MVNIMSFCMLMIYKIMKFIGMQPIEVEIEPGTVIHFWVSKNKNNKNPPLVLIHGFAGDGKLTWLFPVLALRKNYTLYIPDLLFFGGSYTDKTERSPKFQADCLAKGLRKLGVEEKCVVIGFSYGGFVGFQMAEHHPQLVDSVVVTGALVALTESVSSKCLKGIGFCSWPELLIPNSVDGVKVLLDVGSYTLPRMPTLFYRHYLEIMFGNRKERTELLEALVVKDEDVTNHQFHQRIFILCGEEDEIFDMGVVNSLKERLGGKTEIHKIKEAGHLALVERPFVYNKCLKKILNSLVMDTNHASN